jgi:hypothetical protein
MDKVSTRSGSDGVEGVENRSLALPVLTSFAENSFWPLKNGTNRNIHTKEVTG